MQTRGLSSNAASTLLAFITVNMAVAVVGCAARNDDADNNRPATTAIVTNPKIVGGCGGGVCGDGLVDPGEQCDPPNGTTCSESCQTIVYTCGDCVVDPGEQCDPPNSTTCSATCQRIVPPTCGDGVINQPDEQCDPPNETTCSATCQTIVVAMCGDGVINQPSEQCEPADVPAGNFTPSCSATCLLGPSLCATCEASKCDAFFGFPGAWGCAGLTGSDRANCEALVTCIRDTDCAVATNDAQACYCGSATDLGCLTGQADGACRAQYEAAAGTTDAATIATVFTDPVSPVGLANNQITCDADTSDTQSCVSVCPL